MGKTKRRKKMTRKQRRKRKIIVFIIEILILLILLLFVFVWLKLGKINTSKLNEDNMVINELATDEGYTTVAIFGLDNRSNGKLERGNSDVIMVANINNKIGRAHV